MGISGGVIARLRAAETHPPTVPTHRIRGTMAQSYALAEALGEMAALHQLDMESKIKKEREELSTFLKSWWDGWKPQMKAEASAGKVRLTARVLLPINTRRHGPPTKEELKCALPEELWKSFPPDCVEAWMEHACTTAAISISIEKEKTNALKRMKAEGSASTAGVKINKKVKTEAKRE